MFADGVDPLDEADGTDLGVHRHRLRDRIPRGLRYALDFRVKPMLAFAAGGLAGGVLAVGVSQGTTGTDEPAPALAALFGLPLAASLAAISVRRARANWETADSRVRLANARTIRRLVRRIRGQCRQLRRAARRAGAPYAGLARLTDELDEQVGWPASRVFQLRKVARQVRRNTRQTCERLAKRLGPARSAQLEDEFRTTRRARHELSALLADNVAQQAVCLARMERIATLLDSARLELLRPVDSGAEMQTYTNRSVMEEVEAEMKATREAVHDVERREAARSTLYY